MHFKNKLKFSLLTISSLLIGFIIGYFIKIHYEKYFLKSYTWHTIPIVINCYGDDLPKEKVERAIKYWADKGEKIGFYQETASDEICKHDFIRGFIIFKKKKDFKEFSTLANTKRKINTFKIDSVLIQLRPKSYNLDLLLEHELGHALGYSHIDKYGHIMNPVYEKHRKRFFYSIKKGNTYVLP